MKTTSQEILARVSSFQAPHVIEVRGADYFFYEYKSGPQRGWWLFRLQDGGDELELCDVGTVDRLDKAIDLFRLNRPVGSVSGH